MKKSICLILALSLLLCCSACGSSSGRTGIRTVATLVQQDYSLAFRVDDPTEKYVDAAIKVLNAQGKVDELASKWFGGRIIRFEKDAQAMEKLDNQPTPRDFTIGVDVNSFPMAYLSNGEFWGFDVELAIAVTDLLGWKLKIQTIEKENVYIELSSGNIDCAWGGIALDPKEVEAEKYSEYGPYVHNDIVIAARGGSFIYNKLMLTGKSLAMCSTAEAMDALNTEAGVARRLSQTTRLASGTTECFNYLFSGKCDVVLTDSTAIYYFNCH